MISFIYYLIAVVALVVMVASISIGAKSGGWLRRKTLRDETVTKSELIRSILKVYLTLVVFTFASSVLFVLPDLNRGKFELSTILIILSCVAVFPIIATILSIGKYILLIKSHNQNNY